MIGTDLRTVLTSNPGFSAVAGSAVYPLRVPQGKALPAVTYQIISNTPSECKEGVSISDTLRVQINVFAERYETMETITAAIRQTLDHYEGPEFYSRYQSETDLFDNQAETYNKAIDFSITVNR